MKRIERILVGTDFSEIGELAVDCAVDLAAQLGASLVIVHAFEPPAYIFPDGVVATGENAVEQLTSAAAGQLASCVERRKGRAVRIESVLSMGPPWEVLNDAAAQQGADLVVVGTHGRRGFSRVLLGSVAERLLRTSVRPVLAVRADTARAT